MSRQHIEKYKNPSGFEETMEELKTCPSLEEVKKLIFRTFPDLIKNYARGYSRDYPHLNYTWSAMCEAIKTERKGIVLVEFVPPPIKKDAGEIYSLLRKFLDTMTANGFVARRVEEFFLCPSCELAIPSQALYKTLKFIKPGGVPPDWDIKCLNCEAYAPDRPVHSLE